MPTEVRSLNTGSFPRTYAGSVFVVFLVLLTYALTHTIEFDEGWTYISVQHESLTDLLLYKHFNIANNHIINSLWFKLGQQAGMHNLLFYRGLSLLAFPVYAYFLYKTVAYPGQSWKPRTQLILCIFFLPTVLFFFASGRGYSVALTSLCAAMYYMKVYVEERTGKAYWYFMAAGIISSIAIVSFFFPFVAALLFITWKRIPFRIISVQNILTALLVLSATAYIYHIGKTIQLHDLIINGTDNLFQYGMYSTFISSLSIYPTVFPDHQLFVSAHLDAVSKISILATLVPVSFLIIRRQPGRYKELVLLLFTTLLFLASHYILGSKYPSDRSVSYLFLLIYIPVVLYLISTNSIFVKLHLAVLVICGLINLYGLFYEISRPSVYSELKKKPARHYIILSDWPNWADQLYNDFTFKGDLEFRYIAQNFEKDFHALDERIATAVNEPQLDFLLLQQENYKRNESLFRRGFKATPVLSSNSKEFMLLERIQP